MRRFVTAVLAAASLALLAQTSRAADTYEINVLLPLSGNIAFVGNTELQALKALEAYVNRTGGINGRPLSFVVADDQNDPKTSLQLVQSLIAKNVAVIIGPSSPQSCAAIAPLIQNGPVEYCLAQAGSSPPGSYQFWANPYDPAFTVTYRYFRERGLHKIAYIVSTDGGGQDAERTILAGAALPENKDMQLVAREHFAPGDLSVAAQMARIKAAEPDVLIAWATGGPAGTLLRGEHDAGLDVPTYTTSGNINPNFFKQYASVLPTNLYFATDSLYADTLNAPATRAAIATMTTELAALGGKPDMVGVAAWDPPMLIVTALRKLGPDAAAAKLRDYLINTRGWVGVNGPYDFRAVPQRGISVNSMLIVRWDPAHNTEVAVSKLGGAPLR